MTDPVAPSHLRTRLTRLPGHLHPPAVDGRLLMTEAECAAARPAAVLVALVDRGASAEVLLTRRTDHLRAHAGQISFAGGGCDPGDVDRVATALREAQEELGLPASAVEVLGVLPEYYIPTGFRVTPVLAWLPHLPPLQPDPREVAEVFGLPVQLALDPDAWQTEWVERLGRRRPVRVLHYGGHRIWGATAGILVWLGEALRQLPP